MDFPFCQGVALLSWFLSSFTDPPEVFSLQPPLDTSVISVLCMVDQSVQGGQEMYMIH